MKSRIEWNKLYIVGYSDYLHYYMLEEIDAKKSSVGYVLTRESDILQKKNISFNNICKCKGDILITFDKDEAFEFLKKNTKEFNKKCKENNGVWYNEGKEEI